MKTKSKRKPGRPPGDRRQTRRQLRLHSHEDAEICKAAGATPVSRWIREAALEKARKTNKGK